MQVAKKHYKLWREKRVHYIATFYRPSPLPTLFGYLLDSGKMLINQ